jgi:cytochrome b6
VNGTTDNSLWQWFDKRLGLDVVLQHLREKEVPLHRHTIWYYFGGMTLFLFALQAVTGILLLLYYRPSAENAFESVQFIMAQVRFGWLIRSIHSWSANVLVGVLFIHLFSVFFLRAYRRPRELTWITGVLLLFATLAFGFSGYLLPWNTISFFATQVGTQVAGVIPIAGKFLVRFLRGGDEVTGATLTRFFGFHVAILPALVVLIAGLHLLLVQRHGMSVPLSADSRGLKTMKFVPNFFLRDLMGWLMALAALATLSALFPWELGEKADPFASAPAGIRPEWYFMFMFQTLRMMPAKIGPLEGEIFAVTVFGIAAALLLAVPFIDRRANTNQRSRMLTLAGWAAVSYILVMTLLGYRV